MLGFTGTIRQDYLMRYIKGSKYIFNSKAHEYSLRKHGQEVELTRDIPILKLQDFLAGKVALQVRFLKTDVTDIVYFDELIPTQPDLNKLNILSDVVVNNGKVSKI